MAIRFHVKLTHQAEDVRAVVYDIHAYIDDPLRPEQEKILDPLYDQVLEEYVLGRLRATRHASPAMNLNAIDREQEKNPYMCLDNEIEDRLACHADEIPDELVAHSQVGDAWGLIAITKLEVHPCARGEMVGRMLIRHLQLLHAGTAYFAALSAEPVMRPGTPWDQVCEAGHKLTMYLCLEEDLGFDPIVTCDGINLLLAFWDSDLQGEPEENEINLHKVIQNLGTTAWPE